MSGVHDCYSLTCLAWLVLAARKDGSKKIGKIQSESERQSKKKYRKNIRSPFFIKKMEPCKASPVCAWATFVFFSFLLHCAMPSSNLSFPLCQESNLHRQAEQRSTSVATGNDDHMWKNKKWNATMRGNNEVISDLDNQDTLPYQKWLRANKPMIEKESIIKKRYKYKSDWYNLESLLVCTHTSAHLLAPAFSWALPLLPPKPSTHCSFA